MKNVLLSTYGKTILAVILGAVAGYAYYAYIGCLGGSCPITGNPWTSTAYGAVIGALIVPWKRKNRSSPDHDHAPHTEKREE